VVRSVLIAPMTTVGIALLLASCAPNSLQSVTPTTNERHTQFLVNCDNDPSYCTGNGSRNPGPDSGAEDRCNANGGSFIDIWGEGGSGVDCAGEPNGPSDIEGSKCGMQYFIGAKGHSLLVLPDGTLQDDLMGIRINTDDCSWQTFA
jgi:hypothetical protein